MTAAEILNINTGTYTFAEKQPMKLESGKELGPITLYYETYGQLNKNHDNVIMICHALSGGAHVAGPDQKNKPGWWDSLIGPEKGIDTNKYFVICSNIIGSCYGSTGPSSINPATNKPYGMDFPIITIRDIVKAQYHLITDHLKINKIRAVVGGSIGGMQVLEWAVRYPEMVDQIIPIATTTRLAPQAIGFNKIARRAIMLDPKWNKGDYYEQNPELDGLALARMIGHITYLSEEGMQKKFGRELVNKEAKGDIFSFDTNFQVESYLKYQGYKFIKRFDANSYLYLSRAMDLYDLSRGYKSLNESLSRITARMLLIFFTSDWLFPEYQAREMLDILHELNKDVQVFKRALNSLAALLEDVRIYHRCMN